MAATPRKLLFVFGTRPEAVKLAPVIRLARERSDAFRVRVCVTAQHRQMLDPFLALFDLRPDVDLDVMRPDQALSGLVARVLDGVDRELAADTPDFVVVQGDTSTTMAASLAAFHRRVRVAHVEAGLRTWDLAAPFPEEMNRQVVTRVADFHFAPTAWARDNLLREGVPADRAIVTGNTVIDALYWVRDHALAGMDPTTRYPALAGRRLVLVTGHRRESFGQGFEDLCAAIRDVVERHPDVVVLYPVHLNPNVREPVLRILGPVQATGRLVLEQPLEYAPFVALLQASYLVLTDSGGVQEEAPGFGKPVLVMRGKTERPEGVDAGVVRLVGTDRARIVAAVDELLDDPDAWARMARAVNPYGDGHAAGRILEILAR